MRNTRKFTPDLAAAIQSVGEHQAQALTLAELIRAYDAQACTAELVRLRKWVDAFGGRSAWEVQSEQLSAVAQALVDAGYKPSSPNRDLSALGTVYRWAIERRLPPRGFKSPTLGAKRFKEDIRRVYVEHSEVEALRRCSLAYADRRFGVFVNLLLDTGARKGELYQRRWHEVDLQSHQILLPTSKNGDPRTLHFSQSTLELLLRVYPSRPEGALLFEGLVPGQPISYRAAWRWLTESIGRPDLHLHDSRHIVAAGMLRSGVSLPVAAQAIGNTPAVLAARYGHLETATLRKAMSTTWSEQR
jgi:integrase